jgi:HEAT repeat protein
MFDDEPARDTTFLYELARDGETSALVSYLRRGDRPVVRRRAAEILGDFSDVPQETDEEEIVQALIEAVREDDDDTVRARAIDALYRHGQDSLDRLISELADFDVREAPEWVTARTLAGWLDAEHSEFRLVAASALGRIGGEQAVDPLIDALSDPAPRVRERAARSCGRIGDERCVPALRERLDDRHTIVCRAAADALGAIGTREALRALVSVARADDEELRRIAVEELGQFGSLDPVVVLVRALSDDSEAIQRTAVLSLIQLFADAPDEESETVRAEVARQLRSTRSVAVVPPLLDVLSESDRWEIRRNAVWLLHHVADADSDHREGIYDHLIAALGDPDETTADLAAAALADRESEELERRLHILVQDDATDDAVADRAERVLEAIGSDLSQELVTNSVDYTYVADPADYTRANADADAEDNSPDS